MKRMCIFLTVVLAAAVAIGCSDRGVSKEPAGSPAGDAAAAAKFNSIGSMSLLENGSKLNASFRAQ